MSSQLSSMQRSDVAHFLHPYTNLKSHQNTGPMVITKGDGIYVYDAKGNRYIEGLSGLWCTALGFSEKRLIHAATKEMEKLPFFYSFFGRGHDVGIELAEKLIALAPVPMSKAFFTSSGSEANDTAVKLIWYYNNSRGLPKKKKIISRMKAYHGVTIASASLCGLPANHDDFDLPLSRFLHTDCPHAYRYAMTGETDEEFATRLAANLEKMIIEEDPDTIAAFFAEPIMGAGGVLVPPETYFSKIQTVLNRYDVLFVCDEVINGFGRTGNYWGAETQNIRPDIMTMAKALTSAYQPMGALLISDQIYQGLVQESEKLGIFGHGYTSSGHPVCAAVALEAIKIYEERKIVGTVQKIGPLLQDGLKQYADHPLVGQVRGVGMMAAVELVKNKDTKESFSRESGVGMYFGQRAIANGLIVRAIGDSICLAPPLITDDSQIADILEAFDKALEDTTAWIYKEKLSFIN
jgi:4-aminobutyrate--pyruvate transaminase